MELMPRLDWSATSCWPMFLSKSWSPTCRQSCCRCRTVQVVSEMGARRVAHVDCEHRDDDISIFLAKPTWHAQPAERLTDDLDARPAGGLERVRAQGAPVGGDEGPTLGLAALPVGVKGPRCPRPPSRVMVDASE